MEEVVKNFNFQNFERREGGGGVWAKSYKTKFETVYICFL